MGQPHKTPLHVFWDDVDDEMLRLYGKNTFDLDIRSTRIAYAYYLGATAQDAAFLFGRAG